MASHPIGEWSLWRLPSVRHSKTSSCANTLHATSAKSAGGFQVGSTVNCNLHTWYDWGCWCLTRLLSLALAVFRYHGFRLEREDDKLVAAHGLSTRVRAGARLKRLQSWQIDESWLHRRMARCRLSVTVAGGAGQADGGAHGLAPGLQMTELAPIGSWQQARELLSVCVPTLHWETLAWQPLDKAWQGRLWSQGRWLVPALWVGVWLAKEDVLNLEVASAASLAALTLFAWVAYTRAWAGFAAYALSGTVVLYRSGVWHRRWVIVETRRLHVLRLHSSMLDRQLGVVCFQASAQGGSRAHRTLEIPFMPRAIAEQLRATVWHEFAALSRG
ncbi:MAG: hypothetical protein CFE44_03320 [Burkholderiales bacterium PBB4]|nr:MAG: hypothetical protein CFE44_03320 [Burkholderiales bacterium PBB4]